jgi:hypothetical protein
LKDLKIIIPSGMSRLVEYKMARQDAFRTECIQKACIIFSTERIKPDGLRNALRILRSA